MVRRDGGRTSGQRMGLSVSEAVSIPFPAWQTSLTDLDILFCCARYSFMMLIYPEFQIDAKIDWH